MKQVWRTVGLHALVLTIITGLAFSMPVHAAPPPAAPPADNPQSGSLGLNGIVPSTPPTQGGTIATPSNGQVFTKVPITVAGTCPDGLLVKVFANNVFVGSVMCVKGSYSLQIDLFDGRNDLVVRVFDTLDQPGPDSNIVSVTFNNNQFRDTGIQLLALTSAYAKRGANPGKTLSWPVILSGGTAPYAISVDWGDQKPNSLLSLSFTGTFDISHIYDSAGLYNIVVKATDKNGLSAYLQLVGQANGAVTQSNAGSGNEGTIITRTKIIWIPAALLVPLLFIAFWLGRRYEITVLRKHLERAG